MLGLALEPEDDGRDGPERALITTITVTAITAAAAAMAIPAGRRFERRARG
jgi:hypothetical protein